MNSGLSFVGFSPVVRLLLAAIGLLIVGVIVVLLFVLRRSRKPEPSLREPGPPSGEPEAPQHSLLGRFAPTQDLRTSFARAVQFLRQQVSGRDYRYDVPWLLLLGDQHAGKRTLLEQARVGASLVDGIADFGFPQGIRWRFFDQGVLMDVPSDFLLRPDGVTSDEKGWQTLLDLLLKHRARRPIDGAVLTIPCSDLIGPTALTPAALAAKAQHFHEKLSLAQKTLGIAFPIHVLITKCDLVPGFRGFCNELPAPKLEEMFGWSSPYHVDLAFQSSWVDEAFHSMNQSLQGLQSEIFVQRDNVEDPDAVFIFPGEFYQLCAPLRCFLEPLFKETVFQETCRFRGIHICGDVGEPQEAVTPSSRLDDGSAFTPEPESQRPVNWVKPRSLAFLGNLLAEKVFPEWGVAHPLSHVFRSRNRITVGAQLSAAVLLVCLSLGVFFAYRRLSNQHEAMADTLQRIAQDVKSTGSSKPEDKAVYTMLTRMSQLDPSTYHSWFIPGSLVSNIDDGVGQAMVSAFQSQVYTTLYTQLQIQAAKVADTNTVVPEEARTQESIDAAEGLPAPPVLERFPEFLALQSYAAQVRDLTQNAQDYNLLARRESGGTEPMLWRVASYLRDTQPDTPDTRNDYFKRALECAEGPVFEFSTENRAHASAAMVRLVNQFSQKWVEGNVVLMAAQKLENLLDEMEEDGFASRAAGPNADKTKVVESLRELINQLATTDRLATHPNSQWIAAETFKFEGPLYETFVETAKSPLMNPNVKEQIGNSAQSSFVELQKNLAALQSPLTDGRLVRTEAGRLTVSPRFADLSLALQNTVNLEFLSRKTVQALRTDIPRNERLLWNHVPLEQAAEYCDDYKRFQNEGLLSAPANLRTALLKVAASRLEDNLNDLLAQGEDFQPVPPGAGTLESLETEAHSLKESAPSLNTIINTFSANSRNRLEGLLGKQLLGLLNGLDEQLKEEAPYAPKDQAFVTWNGIDPPTLAAFDAKSPDDIAEFLEIRHQRLKAYATAAEPLITFLSARVTSGPLLPRIQKWERIIADLNKFDNKKPGTSVASLEGFIRVDMDKIRPTNACQGAMVREPAKAATADYFLQARNELSRQLSQNCLRLEDQFLYNNYRDLAELFNSTLAGRFPFAAAGPERIPNEADPAALVAFLRLFDRTGKATLDGLKQKSSYGRAGSQAVAFLEQCQRIAAMFAYLLAPSEEGAPLPVLDFQPQFRTNQVKEIGGNEIMDWTLQVGDQKYHYRDVEKTGRWRLGDPVRLTLRWAKDSPLTPAPMRHQEESDLAARARIATYEYTNAWSLFTFLARHQPAPSDFENFVDPQPNTLKFIIDTQQDWSTDKNQKPVATPEAVVFIRLVLYLPGKKEQLLLPRFPTQAPLLAKEQNSATN